MSSTLTAEEAAAVDENASYLGIPRRLLMESAGKEVAQALCREVDVKGKDVTVFAGLGNKGGDGFVTSRYLVNAGAKVHIILLGAEEAIRTEEALENWRILKVMDSTVRLTQIRDSSDLAKLKPVTDESIAIIDAMLGTGIVGPLREPFLSAVNLINSSKAFKLAIDIPTGLNPSTGEVYEGVVKAELTVTMHKVKKGMVGRGEYTGKIIVADIGIPPEAELYAGPGDVKIVLKPRPPQAHKGDFGRILVVGGSQEYSGAPALTALASLRAGADLVIVASPASVAGVIRSFSPNLIVKPLAGDRLSLKNVGEVEPLIKNSTAVAVGAGLGLEPETFEAVDELVRRVGVLKKPILIDADGLKAIAESKPDLEGLAAVLTPHAGEFKMLTGVTLPKGWLERVPYVKEASRSWKSVILLKAHEDIISDGEKVKVNRTGNPGMTVGGTGDVLAGVVATFIGWGVEPFKAAVAGAFINGLAGDLAVKEKGYHILATDVIDELPEVMKRFEPWTLIQAARLDRMIIT